MPVGRARVIESPNVDLVSVIIPTYNRAGLLLQAITSVRQQTWPHIQIIVADDGSTDNTPDLLAVMGDVLYVRQEHRGQGAARNLGLRHARGAYICTLDSDDLWKPEFVENSLRALRTLGADFVFSNWTEETLGGQSRISSFEKEYGWHSFRETALNAWRLMEPDQARAIYVEACVSPSSALFFPRHLISEGWREDLIICDDWDLLLNWVLSRPCRVAVSTQPLWIKRFGGDNVSEGFGDKSVKLRACIHDSRLLFRRFSSAARRNERARLYVVIAIFQMRLCKSELQQKRFREIPGILIESTCSFIRAFSLGPTIVEKCVRELRKHIRRIGPAVNRVGRPSILSPKVEDSP